MVAKPRGDAPPTTLEKKDELQRALGRAARERRAALREAMMMEEMRAGLSGEEGERQVLEELHTSIG